MIEKDASKPSHDSFSWMKSVALWEVDGQTNIFKSTQIDVQNTVKRLWWRRLPLAKGVERLAAKSGCPSAKLDSSSFISQYGAYLCFWLWTMGWSSDIWMDGWMYPTIDHTWIPRQCWEHDMGWNSTFTDSGSILTAWREWLRNEL